MNVSSEYNWVQRVNIPRARPFHPGRQRRQLDSRQKRPYPGATRAEPACLPARSRLGTAAGGPCVCPCSYPGIRTRPPAASSIATSAGAPVGAGHVFRQARLDADDDIAMAGDRSLRQGHIGPVHIVQLAARDNDPKQRPPPAKAPSETPYSFPPRRGAWKALRRVVTLLPNSQGNVPQAGGSA